MCWLKSSIIYCTCAKIDYLKTFLEAKTLTNKRAILNHFYYISLGNISFFKKTGKKKFYNQAFININICEQVLKNNNYNFDINIYYIDIENLEDKLNKISFEMKKYKKIQFQYDEEWENMVLDVIPF